MLRDGERAALRPGLWQRHEKTGEEDQDPGPPRETAIERLDRLRGGQVPGVQQVQGFRRESPSDLNSGGSLDVRGDGQGLISVRDRLHCDAIGRETTLQGEQMGHKLDDCSQARTGLATELCMYTSVPCFILSILFRCFSTSDADVGYSRSSASSL